VTAGKPTELAFTLSRSSVPPPTARAPGLKVRFEVTNGGQLPHDFEVCTAPVRQAKANTCRGEVTRLLEPGQSAALTATFEKRGIYEYLCTVPGEAAAGMKGLIGVGTRPPTPSAPVPPAPVTTTTSGTTTTSAPSSLVGDPNAGKAVFQSAGCGSCHRLAAAGADGDTAASLDMVKPTQPAIIQYVTNGTNTPDNPMPAYAATLTPTQIDDLAAYVYLTTHTIN